MAYLYSLEGCSHIVTNCSEITNRGKLNNSKQLSNSSVTGLSVCSL